MRNSKRGIFVISIMLLFFLVDLSAGAVNTRAIDKVRSKGVLGEQDFQVIDKFVARALRDLVKVKDFTAVAKVRAIVLSRSNSSKQSAMGQYSGQFSDSAKKYIALSFKQASELEPQDRKIKATLNLLILIDSLSDLQLIDMAMYKLGEENTLIRYWAVRVVTSPEIIRQLNSTSANTKLAKRITAGLKGLAAEAEPEELALIINFAGQVEIDEGKELLLQIADERISEYANWTVNNELLDSKVLKLLYEKMVLADEDDISFVQRFGQLYSYAMQMYAYEIEDGLFLDERQKKQLASVLVEIEKSCIGRLLEMPQSTVKIAVERGDHRILSREHRRLFGDEAEIGVLAEKLEFNYGKNTDGSKRFAPLTLPETPAKNL